MPATSTTICSGNSVAPAARAKRSPSRKSRLPTITATGVPAFATSRIAFATADATGSRSWSSPIQLSNRSPST